MAASGHTIYRLGYLVRNSEISTISGTIESHTFSISKKAVISSIVPAASFFASLISHVRAESR